MEIYVKGAPEVMAEICDKSSCECSASLLLQFAVPHARFSPVVLRRPAVVLHETWVSSHRYGRQEHRGSLLAEGTKAQTVCYFWFMGAAVR